MRVCMCMGVCVCAVSFDFVLLNILKSYIEYRSDFWYNFVTVFHFAVMIGVTCTFLLIMQPVHIFILICVSILYNLCMFQ